MTTFERIYQVVRRIPEGKVATYGQVARLAGNPCWARVVGYALHVNPDPATIPCHRVVNRQGRTSPAFAFGGGDIQRDLLENEGVSFCDDGFVDMKKHQWEGNMETLRYGILSTSSIAPRFIAAVRAAGEGEIVAVSSRSLEKAEEKAKLWEIPVFYGDHNGLLNDKNVNIVYISNVNSQHYPWAKVALEAGKHVICEKPCTTTEAQTRELYRLARDKGLFFMEAEKMLFLPALLEVKRRIENGELGEITMVEMSHSFPASYNGWMFDAAVGGGTLLSSGIYAVQLILWLFGEIETIRGTASKLETGVEWQYILTGKTKSGVLFSLKNSTRAKLDNTARIFGEEGYIEIPEYWKARKAVFHTDAGEEVFHIPCQHELIYEAQHIAECFRLGLRESPVVSEEISAQGIRALEQVKNNW